MRNDAVENFCLERSKTKDIRGIPMPLDFRMRAQRAEAAAGCIDENAVVGPAKIIIELLAHVSSVRCNAGDAQTVKVFAYLGNPRRRLVESDDLASVFH